MTPPPTIGILTQISNTLDRQAEMMNGIIKHLGAIDNTLTELNKTMKSIETVLREALKK